MKPLLLAISALVLAAVVSPTARALACENAFDCGGFNPCEITACVNGQCVSSPKDCSDGDKCTVDGCDPRGVGCFHQPLCPDDNLVCNGTPSCHLIRGGTARCFAGALDCNDGNACTLDGCVEPTGCRHVAINCDDGDLCTTDTCDTATGCQHTPVDGCCHTATDCPADACTTRSCVAAACTDGTPRSCDDGDTLTVDTCDPATGCVHTPVGSTSTTTTSLPAGGVCRTDGDCPAPADACASPACSPGGECGSRPVTGFDRLACICRRANAAACVGATLPQSVVKKGARACVLIQQASTNTTKAHKLVGRAARLLKRAQKSVARAKHLSADCVQAEGELLADGETRAVEVRDQL